MAPMIKQEIQIASAATLSGDMASSNIQESQPTSQESSFSTSLATHLTTSSSNLSDSAMTDGDTTPPTSCEDPSSQDHHSQPVALPQEADRPRTPTGVRDVAGAESSVRSMHAPLGTAGNGITGSITAGQKRTASGAVKEPSIASPEVRTSAASQPQPQPPRERHSSTISIESSHGSVGEVSQARPPSDDAKTRERSDEDGYQKLSAQLRARLSYALGKVQHTNGISTSSSNSASTEEETETGSSSAQFSPTSASAHAPDFPPGPSRSPDRRQPFAPLPDRIIGGHSPPRDFSGTNGSIHHDGIPSSSNSQSQPQSHSQSAQSRTYESFWRDHSTNSVSQLLHAQRRLSNPGSSLRPPLPQNALSLAPPADIVSSASRPTHRRLSNTVSSPVSGSTNPHPSFSPKPSSDHPRTPILRTPSQKAAMEQDAVETLLFMSSPRGLPPLMPVADPPMHAAPGPPSQHRPHRDAFGASTSPSKGIKRVEFHAQVTGGSELRRLSSSASASSADDVEAGDVWSGRGNRLEEFERRPGLDSTGLSAKRGRARRQDDAMDRMLDGMADEDSDE